MLTGWTMLVLSVLFVVGVECAHLNEYISHYRALDYDTGSVHSEHVRSKRSAAPEEHLQLNLHSGLTVRLRRSAPAFFPEVTFIFDGVEEKQDLSHLYVGAVDGAPGSVVSCALIEGRLEGTITFANGTKLHIEAAHHFFDGHPGFHSVMYSDHDVDMGAFHKSRRQRREAMSDTDHITCGLSLKAVRDEIKREQAEMTGEQVEPIDKEETPPLTKQAEDFNWAQHHKGKYHDSEEMEEGAGARKTGGKTSPFMEHVLRNKRATSLRETQTTCSLFMQADQELWRYYQGVLSSTANQKVAIRDSITSLFNQHVENVNAIYRNTRFIPSSGDALTGYGFRILRIAIDSTENCKGPFCDRAIGVTNFLNLNSYMNHDLYCLAYVFTYRDFEGGTLGLAWVGSAGSLNGGVCSKFRTVSENGRSVSKSLNTGIVSLLNYGKKVSSSVSYITFAHEAGHNFGSNHDSPAIAGCTGNGGDDGNFIMYASATSGNLQNNRKFSPCSNTAIANVLHHIKRTLPESKDCFTASDEAWCGNSVREDRETCDCGYARDAQNNECQCCVGRPDSGPTTTACTLSTAPGVQCDPSQGPCCTESCQRTTSGMCLPASECAASSFCSGVSAECPKPASFEEYKPCNDRTQVCKSGECGGSICEKIAGNNYKPCYSEADAGKCHIACSDASVNGTCWSSVSYEDPAFPRAFYQLLFSLSNSSVTDKSIKVQPGHPCDNLKGFCDTLYRCRPVDADGPLARLKKLFFSAETIQALKLWATEYWWALGLMVIGLITFMALFIKFCAVHTPSSNPNKKAHRSLTQTLTIRRGPRQHRAAGDGGRGGGGQRAQASAPAQARRPRAQPQSPPQPQRTREDDDVQLAIAMSLSDQGASSQQPRSSRGDAPPAYPGSGVPQNYKRQTKGVEMQNMRV